MQNNDTIYIDLLRLLAGYSSVNEPIPITTQLTDISTVFSFDCHCIFKQSDSTQLQQNNAAHITEFFSSTNDITQETIINFIVNHDGFNDHSKQPVIGSVLGYSLVGLYLSNNQWGIFCSKKLPLNDHLSTLNLWCATVSDLIKLQSSNQHSNHQINTLQQSQRKFDMIQTLSPIAEFSIQPDTTTCTISESFLGFFDHSQFKTSYTLDDLYHLIGESNKQQLCECIEKVMTIQSQVVEEFDCIMTDTQTIQSIKVLFDPIINNDNVIQINGYAKDNGRKYIPSKNNEWDFDHWMTNAQCIPIQWERITNNQYQFKFPTMHWSMIGLNEHDTLNAIQDVLDQYDDTPPKRISVLISIGTIECQLIAHQMGPELTWNGVIIQSLPLAKPSNITDKYHQSCIKFLLKALASTNSISDYHPSINFFIGLSRHTTQSYPFLDFYNQLKSAATTLHPQLSIHHQCMATNTVHYGGWIIAIVEFIIKYFHLDLSPLSIQCKKATTLYTKHPTLNDSANVLDIAISTTNIAGGTSIIKSLFKTALIGIGCDVHFEVTNFEWCCHIYVEMDAVSTSTQQLSNQESTAVLPSVLIVDDDNYNIKTLEIILQSVGFKAITATNGNDALTKLNNNIPHLILLDIKMPDMDGFELMRHINKHPNYSQIPIIILSAHLTPEIRDRLNGSNVASIIEKPFDNDDLIQHIQAIMSQKQLTTTSI